jgi:hypothetical protein
MHVPSFYSLITSTMPPKKAAANSKKKPVKGLSDPKKTTPAVEPQDPTRLRARAAVSRKVAGSKTVSFREPSSRAVSSRAPTSPPPSSNLSCCPTVEDMDNNEPSHPAVMIGSDDDIAMGDPLNDKEEADAELGRYQ